jgi:unsaturated rhamnogalacturonyl hydrolase
MKRLCLLISFIVSSYLSFSQSASSTWAVKFSNAITTRWNTTASGGRVCIDKMTAKGWEYSNAIVLHGIEKVYKQVNTAAYRTYIKTYVDAWVNSSGVVTGQTINSLDRLHPAILLLFLYEDPATTAADKARYKTSADSARNFLVGPKSTYPKTSAASGSVFWHKNNGSYNDIVMLDGIYMAHPFLAKYGRMFNDNAAIDTAVNQTLRVYNQLYDGTTHLIKHAWNPTKTQTWANASTGNSTSVWSRAMGWFVMALVDELKYVQSTHPKRAQLIAALDNLAVGIKNYQDPTSNLWYQIVDKTSATLSGNYIETSGSAMFVYALKTASDSGWISSTTYLPVAQNAWNSLKLNKISINADGGPQINNFAPAMGVQNTEALYVQASLQPVSCPSDVNPHGYAAILMAASVMEFPLITTLPVNFINFTATLQGTNILLKWQNNDFTEVANYVIERSENGIDFIAVASAKSQSINNQWLDISPIGSTLYYRIKAISVNNALDYSKVIAIIKQTSPGQLNVSPNPVKNGVVNIFINGLKAGSYQLTVSNSAGEMLIRKSISCGNEKLEEIIHFPASAKGLFYVQLKGADIVLKRSILVH